MRISGTSITKGITFFKFVKTLFILIAVISILSKGYMIWSNTHEIEPIIEALGDKLFNPLYNLAEHLQNIATNGLWVDVGSFFSNFKGFFVNIWLLIEPIFLFYYSVYYLFLFSKHIIIMDSSRTTNALIVTSVIYFLLSFTYIKVFTDLPGTILFTSIGNIFRSIANIFL